MLTPSQKQRQQHIENTIAQGKLNEAHQLLVNGIRNTPLDHFSYFLLAQVNLAAADVNKALKLLEKALSINEHPLYFAHCAKLAVLTGQLITAEQHIDKTLSALNHKQAANYDAFFCDTIANVLTRLGHYKKALDWQQNAFKSAPTNPQISYNLAVGYKVMGQFTQAKALLQQLISTHPTHFQAHYSLAELNDKHSAQTHLTQLLALTGDTLSMSDSHYAYHAIALNHEYLNAYKEAYDAFIASKKKIKQKVKYSALQHSQFCQQLITLSLNKNNTHKILPACYSFAPIFIVGMPRSGTTLMEKILNQSEAVIGLGELNDIAQLCQGGNNQLLNNDVLAGAYHADDLTKVLSKYQQRVSQLVKSPLRSCDKQPFNFYYIDLILAAFPNAKIICMQRGQKDSCIANFRQLYNPTSAFHHYSYDLDNINSFYNDYSNLIAHFAAKHANNVMIMQYEELVSEPISNTQKVYEFCDLTWQEQCLDFYKQQSPSATASKIQVRQPLNRKAVNYWQHYQFAVDKL